MDLAVVRALLDLGPSDITDLRNARKYPDARMAVAPLVYHFELKILIPLRYERNQAG